MPRHRVQTEDNNHWRLIKSEIPVTFRMMCRLIECLMNAKTQMLDSFPKNENNDRWNYYIISFAFCPGKGLGNNLREVQSSLYEKGLHLYASFLLAQCLCSFFASLNKS